MSADPRAALNQLTVALERHLEACSGKRGEDDPTVMAAYEDVADAFEAYDDALLHAYNEMTPLDLYNDDDEDAEELEDEQDGDDDERYSGLADDDLEDEDDDDFEDEDDLDDEEDDLDDEEE